MAQSMLTFVPNSADLPVNVCVCATPFIVYEVVNGIGTLVEGNP
jgi:hypothetical protein